MGETSITITEEAKNRLDLHRRDGESYSDTIIRLTEQDKWAGFGIASGSSEDTREGMEKIREEMNQSMEEDIERMNRPAEGTRRTGRS